MKYPSRRAHRRPMLEPLEPRTMLAPAIQVFRVESALFIEGTSLDDTVHIEKSGSSILVKHKTTLDPWSRPQRFSHIDRIIFQGNAGNDTFYNLNWNSASAGTPRMELYGGTGNDRLFGGDANDLIFGDEDVDTIFGGYGNDQIKGGSQKDVLHGGPGHDVIFGGDGNDVLWGEDGNDRLFGGPGYDDLRGGNHNDFLDDGSRSSNERLNGGRGINFDADRPSLDGAEFSDIYQGRANTCHMMGALSAVAKTGRTDLAGLGRIRYLGEDRGVGKYQVLLYSRFLGLPTWYDVEFSGSWTAKEPRPVHERGNLAEFWTILYERAYEKRGYLSLPNGFGRPSEALEAITGNSVANDTSPTLAEISRQLARNQIVLAGVRDPTKNLVKGHTYLVMRVDAVKQTVTLRNPWGGPSPKSIPRTDHGSGRVGDGIFTVSWSELVAGWPSIFFGSV